MLVRAPKTGANARFLRWSPPLVICPWHAGTRLIDRMTAAVQSICIQTRCSPLPALRAWVDVHQEEAIKQHLARRWTSALFRDPPHWIVLYIFCVFVYAICPALLQQLERKWRILNKWSSTRFLWCKIKACVPLTRHPRMICQFPAYDE